MRSTKTVVRHYMHPLCGCGKRVSANGLAQYHHRKSCLIARAAYADLLILNHIEKEFR